MEQVRRTVVGEVSGGNDRRIKRAGTGSLIHKETKKGGCETDEIISPKGKGERRKRNKRETKKSCEYAKVRRKQKGEYRKTTEESKMSCVVDVFKTVSTEAFEKAPYLRNPPL